MISGAKYSGVPIKVFVLYGPIFLLDPKSVCKDSRVNEWICYRLLFIWNKKTCKLSIASIIDYDVLRF